MRIDRLQLARLLELPTAADVAEWQRKCVREQLVADVSPKRCPEWTESIAVGDRAYLESVRDELGIAARHRTMEPVLEDAMALRESPPPYSLKSEPGNAGVSAANTIRWDLTC